jgi:integrase
MVTTVQAGFRTVSRPSDVDSPFDLIVVDNDGLPHLPLTAFYAQLQEELSIGAARTYNSVLLPFFTWATSSPLHARSHYRWDGPPEQVRALVRDYLLHGLGCAVQRLHAHEDVRATEHSAKTVKLFLAALKRFYRFAVGEGWYLHDDPLLQRLSFLFSSIRREALRSLQAPQQSMSGMYFRFKGAQWEPRPLLDADLPLRLRDAAGPARLSLRDQIIVRLAYEAGPRLSEIVGLTIGGWRISQCRDEAETFNKGSRGVQTKTLGFSKDTSRLLHAYVIGDRRRLDPLGRTLGQLDDSDPLFLSQRRKPYSRAAFMPHWYRLRRAAGLRLRVHDLRHWHVTQAMALIYEQARDEGELALAKERLQRYMGWRSDETLAAYEHVTHAREHLARVLRPLHARWASGHANGQHNEARVGGAQGAGEPATLPSILARPVARVQAQRDPSWQDAASSGSPGDDGWGDLLP